MEGPPSKGGDRHDTLCDPCEEGDTMGASAESTKVVVRASGTGSERHCRTATARPPSQEIVPRGTQPRRKATGESSLAGPSKK